MSAVDDAPEGGPAGRRRPGPPRTLRRPDRQGRPASPHVLVAESGALGLIIGLAVVLPWTAGGYLLLLDWVSGPQQTLNPGVYGLSASSLDAMPFRLLTQTLRATLGPAVTAWLLLLAFFPIAAAGASALAGGGRVRRHVAASVMVLNPFVVERLHAGHVAFLLSVALLPWLGTSVRHARHQGGWFASRPAGWFALASAIDPHAAFLGGVLLLVMTLLPAPGPRDLVRFVGTVLAAALVNGYGLAVLLTGIRTIRVTEADLEAYATRDGPAGSLGRVLTLHGFWRSDVTPEPFLMPVAVTLVVCCLAMVVLGAVVLQRLEPDRAAPLVAVTVVGLLLGAGVNGPVGWLYRWAFDHVPLFETMREQEKWVALALLGYAVFLGALAERAVMLLQGRRALAVGATAVTLLLPLLSAPFELWGLGGSVTTSRYPADWYTADGRMGEGVGSVLFLPWHEYQPFDFTAGRTVATPGDAFFSRPVLSSDAVELAALRTDSVSRRTARLDRVLASGQGLVPTLRELGVSWVVLATDRDPLRWQRILEQPGLVRVQDGSRLDLYRVSPDPISDRLAQRSATVFTVAPGRPQRIVVPVEWSPGWVVDGRPGEPTAAGATAFQVGPGATTISYAPWRVLAPASAASLATLVFLLVAGLAAHRRELGSWLSRLRRRTPER